VPWDTVERLDDGDIVLFVMVYPMVTRRWTRISEARAPALARRFGHQHQLRGQPDHIYADRLGAQVNGWNIDLLIFYGGGDPTAVRRCALNERRDRARPKSNWHDLSYRPASSRARSADLRFTFGVVC